MAGFRGLLLTRHFPKVYDITTGFRAEVQRAAGAMETKFTQFLRNGGNGAFLIRREGDVWFGGRTDLASKSEFPNYTALRDGFAARLDTVILLNTTMLLRAVAALYDPPLTADDLPDVDHSRADMLAEWERRIEVIWTEWHSHPQRLRPIREAMEQHLLRAFAGLINQLRQNAMGFSHYIWRSSDDDKVRSSHAAHDDRLFSWDDPPEGGHPGQAWGCRCHAEPMVPRTLGNVLLAEFVLPADGAVLSGRAIA